MPDDVALLNSEPDCRAEWRGAALDLAADEPNLAGLIPAPEYDEDDVDGLEEEIVTYLHERNYRAEAKREAEYVALRALLVGNRAQQRRTFLRAVPRARERRAAAPRTRRVRSTAKRAPPGSESDPPDVAAIPGAAA